MEHFGVYAASSLHRLRLTHPILIERVPSLQVNVTSWNKEFNDRTGPFEQGIPIPTRTYINEDKSYRLVLYHPPLSILVKKAAGITRGAMEPLTETVGLISLKHVYHIAEMKRQVIPPQGRFPVSILILCGIR